MHAPNDSWSLLFHIVGHNYLYIIENCEWLLYINTIILTIYKNERSNMILIFSYLIKKNKKYNFQIIMSFGC